MPDIAETLRGISEIRLFDDHGGSYASSPKAFAQSQLQGRTHYVDDDTLRFHHSRIVKARVTQEGAFFWLIECCALDFENTRRGYRYAIFDVFGRALDRPDLEHAASSKAAAEKAFWAAFNVLDTVAYYRETLSARARRKIAEAARLEAAALALKA